MEPPYLRKLRKQYEHSQQTDLFSGQRPLTCTSTYHVQPVARENLQEELRTNNRLRNIFTETIGDRLDY